MQLNGDRAPRGGVCDAIIIGAGHNGLAAACYLARAGADVLVLESRDVVGGMTLTEAPIAAAPDHLFSTCAIDVVFMRASPVVRELELARFGYREIEQEAPIAYLSPDGGSIAFWRDPVRTANEVRRYSRRDASAFLDMMNMFDRAFDIVLPMLTMDPTRPRARSVFQAISALGAARSVVPGLTRLLGASVADVIDDTFEHPVMRDPMAVYMGQIQPIADRATAPWLAGWALIHKLGHGRVVGGTGGLPAALMRCLAEAGGRVRTGAVVEALHLDQGKVVGVRLATGEVLRSRAVISTNDPRRVLTEMLPAGSLSDRLLSRAAGIPTSGDGAVGICGLVAMSGELDLSEHERNRDDDLDLRKPCVLMGTFDQVLDVPIKARAGELPDFLPSLVTVPNAADPTMAPEGQDGLHIFGYGVPLEPAAGDSGFRERAGAALIRDGSTYYKGAAQFEIGRALKTADDLADRYRTTHGSWQVVEMRLSRSGPFRPAFGFANRTPVDGLILSGAGTHPSSGVSGVAGKLAAELALRKLRGRGGAASSTLRPPLERRTYDVQPVSDVPSLTG